MDFAWDESKDASNRVKHGISFDEATEVFADDVHAIEIYDAAHSETEERFITIGPIRRGLVLVVRTEREDEIVRIISARWASRMKAQRYRAAIGQEHD